MREVGDKVSSGFALADSAVMLSILMSSMLNVPKVFK